MSQSSPDSAEYTNEQIAERMMQTYQVCQDRWFKIAADRLRALQPATPTGDECCKGLAPAFECRCEIERKAAGHPPYQRYSAGIADREMDTRLDLAERIEHSQPTHMTGKTTTYLYEQDRMAMIAALRAPAQSSPDGYHDAWLAMIAHCNEVKADRFRLEQTIRDSIEALERNSTSAPVVECLKAALPSTHQSSNSGAPQQPRGEPAQTNATQPAGSPNTTALTSPQGNTRD